MSRRATKQTDALASTGSTRRDRETQAQFARLCTKVPLLQTSAPAKTQLTQIVFGSLAELRAHEDRAAELCTDSLSARGCSLCSWKQKAFCEACGSDFAKTQNRSGYPLFIPVYDAGLLHIDVCMLCSDACVNKLMASKEQMQAEKEAAKAAAAAARAGSKGAAAPASSVRVSRIAADPHHSIASLVFHGGCYAALLAVLLLADLSVADLLRAPLGLQLLLCLLLFGLWLLNLMFTCTARGEIASVFRLRQGLSAAASVVAVSGAASLMLYVAAALLGHGAKDSTAAAHDSAHSPLLELALLVVPTLMCAVEIAYFPHAKMNRWVERVLCVVVPSLLLALCLRQQPSQSDSSASSVFSSLPDPLFGLDLHSSPPGALASFACVALASLCVGTLAFQRARDHLWRHYLVPKHLQMA